MTFDAATAICAACVAALGALWWVAPLLELPDDEPAEPATAADVIAEAKARRSVDPGPVRSYWEHPNRPAPWHAAAAPTWALELACVLAITARFAPGQPPAVAA